MRLKKYLIFSLFTICFLFILITDSYAEQDISFHCGTDPKLVQELHQELVEKKISELNTDYSPWDNEISLFSIPFGVIGRHYMPSTGDVKAIVLPIEFKDEKFSKDMVSYLQQVFFNKQDINNVAYKDLSVCDYFSKVSYDKLRLSGIVLPIYTAKEKREYYEDSTILMQEIATALSQNMTILGDLSEYDYNNDGYIDCLNVIWAGSSGGWSSSWWGALHSGPPTDLYNYKKIKNYVGVAESQATTYTFAHEIGHALGLPDNYEVTSDSCVLSNGTYELMQGNGFYINAFYKYLLDWEEPEILLYKDINSTVDLYASDIYNNELSTKDKTQAIVFTPDIEHFPFSEFYIAEYRTYDLRTTKDSSGIIIWHCNPKENTSLQGTIKETADYIEPVYKSNDKTSFKNEDLYRMDNNVGDIWSATSSPSSDFYNGYKTGAYLKVTGMDEEKATVEVGFQDMGWEQPLVSVTGKNEYSDNYGRVCFTLSYDNVYSMMGNMPTDNIGGKYLSRETIDKYIDIETTGNIQAQIDYENCLLNNKNQIVIWVKGIDKDAIEGEGTVQLILKEGSAINGFKKCESAESPIVEISELDKTPPKVLDVTYFPPWRTRGKVIAFITADEEITTPEVVFTANKNLATSVYDLAGNRTSLQLKVNWISTFWDEDYKTLLPEGILRYSTQEATNQDVTVRLEPLEDVKESSEELIHTFEDNGEYTFTFTDKYGNVNTKTAVVDWIDKEPPEIVLNGESQITLVKGDSYTERGAVATDNRDGTVDVTINGDVDTSQSGTYYIRYSAVDSLGNASEVTRTVNVLESEYIITFKNYDGNILQNQNIRTNTIPEYTGETPVKPSDDEYTYTFSGWSPQITAVSGEATYTAQYTAIPRVYNITLNAKGGTVENPVTEYTYGTGATLPIPTRTGYTFNGWYDNEACTGAIVTEISATDTGDKVYYAKWTPNIYTVTYDYNEATGGNSVKTKTVVYDSEYGTLPVPSKIGCIFDGWHTADNVKVTSETIVSIAENHTLRAQWADCPHTWDNGKITKNATCTATGTALFTCTVCADTKTEDIAILPHTEVADARVEPTCTKAGKEEGSHCSVCNTVIKAQKVIPATGHNFEGSVWTITVNPSESVTGIAERICKNDNSHKDVVTLPVLTDTSVWTTVKAEPSENTDGLMEYTSQYGTVTVVIPATGHTHNWGDWVVVYNPTMEKTGTAERTCTKNNAHKETITVPNLSDKIWSKGSYLSPTCTENGSQKYISDDYGSVTVIIEATGHTVVIDKAVAATCETAGKTEGSHCSVCNTVITEQKEIDAIGHDWGDWNISKEPSETETGEAEKCCKNDNSHSTSTELPNLSDSMVWVLKEYKEPTEEADGYKKYISDYGTVTITLPMLESSDRVNFTNLNNGYILAEIIFNKTQPPESNNVQMIVAFKKDNILQSVQIPPLTGFNAIFDIPEKYMDCDIYVYIWDKTMKPLMGVQKIDL